MANSATTTVTYQVSASADDGYAWSATEQDISSSYLMIGDDRTYTAPYYMSAMRFTNISIPRSATIIDARLKISSIDQEYRGQIYGVIQVESTDDAADFSSRYIAAATKTTAATNWDHKTAWPANTYYTSPDISTVIQEVVNRPGWNSGNSAVVFYSTRADSGKSRMFGSFESGAGFAAVLEIIYETYSISGHIKTSDNTPIEGVTVSAGADIESTTTDADGYYELFVPPGWTGTVTPSKTDWGFNPASRTYSNVTSDQINQDYTAFQPVISGYVKDSGGLRIEGVLVSADNGGGSDITNANGYYKLTVPYYWSGTVEVSKDGWGFSPWERSYSNVTTNQTNQNYTAFQPTISGYIRTADGNGLEAVTISANNEGGVDSTDTSGYYEITVPYNWSGEVTLEKIGWDFEPTNQSYENIITDLSNEDYLGFTGTIYVDKDGAGDFTTIQDAIDATIDGHTIIVNPGTYIEKVRINGKDITLRSINPHDPNIVKSTIIYGTMYGGSVVCFDGTETSDCLLSGLSIRGGRSQSAGGIRGSGTHATIQHCIISGNEAYSVHYGYGGGLHNCDGEITNCIIKGNRAHADSYYAYGGGLYDCDGNITNCIISNNSVYSNYYYSYGGGLYNCDGIISNCVISKNYSYRYYSNTASGGGLYNCDGTIINCTIVDNGAANYGGGLYGCDGTIKNNIIWDNFARHGPSLYNSSDPSYCCIEDWAGGGEGNFSDDPLFLNDGYHLSADSPCINTGDPNYIPDTNDVDIDGDPRVVGRVDIGADEFFVKEGAYIVCKPSKLRFNAFENRANPQPQAFSITNVGSGELNYTVQSNVEWLQVSPENGQLSSGEWSNISVAADTNELAAGDYSESLTITSDSALNSPQVVDVNLHIIGPELSIDVNEFNFQASKETLVPPEQYLTITNATTGGTLNWQIAIPNDCNWLSVSPNSGSCTTEPDIVSLSVDINEVNYGSYSCQFTVSAPNAVNSPQAVTVNLDVLPPELTVSPSQFYFEMALDEPNDFNQVLSIQNTGYDTLRWQIAIPPDCNWLSVEPVSGQSTGEINEVTLSVDANGMDIGFNTCELTISDPNAENSPQTVQVGLHVYIEGQRHVPAEYQTIQAAVDAAFDGDEVIIEPGIYTGPGNYDIYFMGKAITVRSVAPNNPAIVAATIIEPNTFAIGFHFHKGEQADSVVDGLTIRRCIGGPAIGCWRSSPTIRNCIIEDNFHYDSRYYGGTGIECYERSSPVISNCVIRNNYGSGLRCSMSDPTVRNCTFTGNRASYNHYYYYYGGETSFGGGILSQGGDISVINCTFSGNVADMGGGICSFGSYANISNLTISNCIFRNNDANDGSQIALIDYGYNPPTVSVSYSDVQGGEAAVYVDPCCTLDWDDDNNLDIDPCFAVPGYWHTNDTPGDVNDDFWVNGDYHLKSGAGRWDANSESWYIDANTSPCIDAGDPNSDWTAELWPHGKRINMGAYGGTPEASMSLSDAGNIADLNGDDSVGYADIILFIGKWLYEEVLLAEDLDRSGIVNFIDFAIFADNWEGTPGQASYLNPADGATGVDPNADLSWTAGYGATSHDVYFGTSSLPPFVYNQTFTTFDPGTMDSSTVYYWRIDEVNSGGRTTGEVWSFTTFGPPSPPPPLPPPPL